jgi:hypothetical protein
MPRRAPDDRSRHRRLAGPRRPRTSGSRAGDPRPRTGRDLRPGQRHENLLHCHASRLHHCAGRHGRRCDHWSPHASRDRSSSPRTTEVPRSATLPASLQPMSTVRCVVPTDGLHPVSQPPASDWRSRRWPIGPNGPLHPPSGQRRPPTGPGRPCPSPLRIDRYDQTRLRRRWACHLESARNQRNAAQPCRQPIWGNGRPWTDGERDEKRRKGPRGGPFKRNPAASYSPRESPPKYHRRWWA